MSYIPDCRTDDNYNETKLNARNMDYIAGYDWAVEQILNLFDGNSDVFPRLADILDENTAVVNEDKEAVVRESIEQWSEMQRNELITSMLDDQYGE